MRCAIAIIYEDLDTADCHSWCKSWKVACQIIRMRAAIGRPYTLRVGKEVWPIELAPRKLNAGRLHRSFRCVFHGKKLVALLLCDPIQKEDL